MKDELVLIIDLGSQVTQLIARRLRQFNVLFEIHPFNKITDELIKTISSNAIILSRCPTSVLDDYTPIPPSSIFNIGISILGVCYRQQIIIKILGGKVINKSETSEFSKSFVKKKIFSLHL